MKPCGMVKSYQNFEGAYCRHLDGHPIHMVSYPRIFESSSTVVQTPDLAKSITVRRDVRLIRKDSVVLRRVMTI
jgi:hypothetical protein